MEGGEINEVTLEKKKRRGSKAPRRRQIPYTARGHRFRVQGPVPSSAGLKPGARPPCPWGLAAPEEGGGRKQRGEVAIIAWTPPQPCVCLAEEGGKRGHPCGDLYSPCCPAGGSWHLGGTEASSGRY